MKVKAVASVVLIVISIVIFASGCNAQGALDNGELRISYQPAIIFRVDTGLWFNGSPRPLVELNGEVEGNANSLDSSD